MYIYELKDGCQLKLIQKVHKLNVFDREIEDVTYDIKIITNGLIESKSVQDEKYDNWSRNDIVRTTNLYLKNYTYAIVLYIGREPFYNGKVGGVIDCIKNISIYLRNLNDKEALKTAKEVIKQIRQANSEYKDFSMNSLLREENNDFIFNVLDENVYFAKKLINEKTKKYEVISKKAQFQLGYKGYIQLAIRSGQYKDIDVIEVREGEYLGRNKITGKHQFEFIEDEVERENKPIIGYMAYFEYLNGFYKNLYWSKEKMQKHALEYSQAYASDVKKGTNYSFWSKDFDGMAFKTMLRQLISKWGIMSIDMQEALTKDMSVIKEDGTCDYVDNQPIVSVPTEEKINTEVAETTEKTTEVKQVNINEL